jgi:hypothetical protein
VCGVWADRSISGGGRGAHHADVPGRSIDARHTCAQVAPKALSLRARWSHVEICVAFLLKWEASQPGARDARRHCCRPNSNSILMQQQATAYFQPPSLPHPPCIDVIAAGCLIKSKISHFDTLLGRRGTCALLRNNDGVHRAWCGCGLCRCLLPACAASAAACQPLPRQRGVHGACARGLLLYRYRTIQG